MEVLKREHVDVLLADIAMPDEDGYSLIKQIRASEFPGTASLPAAALTSFARQEDRQAALQAGFHLHLAKPIDPRHLVEAVACLGRREAAP
jgi:CheY-like chemotaxis protein